MLKYIIAIKGKPFIMEDDILTPLDDNIAFEVKDTKTDIRTIQQNRALHKYFGLVSEALNDAGHDMKTVIKADVNWTPEAVKEVIWKRIQEAMVNKDSTTQIKKSDIDTIYHVVNRLLGERFGIHIPFPSLDNMIFEQQLKDK